MMSKTLPTHKRGLETQGFKVDAFNLPVEVPLDKAKQCDIAILDVKMPEINGFQLARLLWQQNEKLQVCFLSAFDINENEAKATLPNLKSHCFLTKPMTSGQVAKHIEMHLLKH
jgi:DNA-binding response OmpR family regulator